MSIPGSVNPLFLGAAGQATAATGYQIERSVRFNSPDSAYLSRTPASSGNRKTWTWAGWVKKCSSKNHILLSCVGSQSDTGALFIDFLSDDSLRVLGWSTVWRKTTQVFRDPSAWFHLVVAFDSTQSTANNRIRVYVNGSEVTTFATLNNPTQNTDFGLNQAALHEIGRYTVSSVGYDYLNAYLADVFLIDGQALTPTSFGEFDTNGVWQPKAFSGGSYGTNGFRLPFSDNSAATATTLGKDAAGSNNWTPNNVSVFDGSVLTAGGGRPIYNTTDLYGTIKGTGTRTDTNASSLVLAVPMDGTNGGTTFSDESATVKGSGSAKSITRNNTTTSTSQSFYYGSSGSFNGSNTNLEITSALSDFAFGGDFTIECWLYLNSGAASDRYLFDYRNSGPSGQNTYVYFNDSGNGGFRFNMAGAAEATSSTGVAPKGAWHHFALVRSGSTITAYINGVSRVTQTNSSSVSAPGQSLKIGSAWTNSTQPWDGFISDFRVYNGVAKYTTAFSLPSRTAGSGNDSLVDSPTNGSQVDTGVGGEVVGNYCTLNPLDNGGALVLTNGNLEAENTTADHDGCRCTIKLPSSGKWYYEGTVLSPFSGTTANMLGVATGTSANPGLGASGTYYILVNASGAVQRYIAGGSTNYTGFSTPAIGSVLQVAYDADSGKLWFGLNNLWMDGSSGVTGSPSTGSNETVSSVYDVFPSTSQYSTKIAVNFGQRPFAYTAPSGFKALTTANLPEPTIADGSTVMDVALYTGNGSTQTISGLNFSPDFVWIKPRSVATQHNLYDAVRGATKALFSDFTDAEATVSNGLTAFNSDGFSLGSNQYVNDNAVTFVAWAWDAGSSNTTIAAGSLNSSVYDQSQTWSNNITGGSGAYGAAANAFNGSLSDFASPEYSSPMTYTNPSASDTVISTFEIYGRQYSTSITLELNDTDIKSQLSTTVQWHTITGFTGQNFSKLYWRPTSGNLEVRIYAIRINGKILVDSGVTPPNVPAMASTVRANPSAGFSVVTYTGNGNNATVGHGLNVVPALVITKDRSATNNWLVVANITGYAGSGYLNLTDAFTSRTLTYTSTTFRTLNASEDSNNGANYVAYCFAPVAGYSAMGSYVGNGSSDGVFVYTGFRSRWILIKVSAGDTGNWWMYDSARSSYNLADLGLYANSSIAEFTSNGLDMLSNGFKIRTANGNTNGSGYTFVWAAFAENPFQYARAR